jgi:hypothetical protein
MRVRIVVVGGLLIAACQGPEVFRPGQGQSLGQPLGTAGTSNLPIMTTGGAGTGMPLDMTGAAGTAVLTGLAGTGGGAAGTTGAAGTGAAGTGAAGTGSAGTGAVAVGGAGGSQSRDGGVSGGAGTSAPRDAAPEAPPVTPYAATGWKPTASVTAPGNADVAANAFDGDLKTRWATGRNQAGNESFLLDLGASKSVSRVVLDATTHPNDFPAAYTLDVSTNGTAFTNATMGKGAAVTDIQLTRVMARYVRIRQTGTTPAPNGAWWSIDEIKVYP